MWVKRVPVRISKWSEKKQCVPLYQVFTDARRNMFLFGARAREGLFLYLHDAGGPLIGSS